MNKHRINPFSFMFGLIIDLALIGMGVLIYYHFEIYSLGPVGLSPLVVNLFGSRHLAVLVISGIPIIVGVFSLLGTINRAFKNLFFAKKTLVKN